MRAAYTAECGVADSNTRRGEEHYCGVVHEILLVLPKALKKNVAGWPVTDRMYPL